MIERRWNQHSCTAAVCAVVLISASCSNRDDRSVQEPAAAAAPEQSLAATARSLGPIEAATPFNAVALASLFPAMTVSETMQSSEGEEYPVLRIEMAGQPVFDVRSADGIRIDSVEILDGASVVSLQARHGVGFSAVFAGTSAPACVAGTEEMSGSVVCAAPGFTQVTLIFTGQWDGPDGEMPPAGIMTSWTVERIIWRP